MGGHAAFLINENSFLLFLCKRRRLQRDLFNLFSRGGGGGTKKKTFGFRPFTFKGIFERSIRE
jgi:hypothetical protein